MPASRTAKTQPKLKLLEAPSLASIPWLTHGFSTRQGGRSRAYGRNALNLGFTPDDTKTAVVRNREWLVSSLGKRRRAKWELVTLRQVHSDLIHLINRVPEHPLSGDGMITATAGLLLAVLTADCFPLIIADPKRRAVGVFHAGWRGTVKRVAEKGVGEMRKHFGSIPSQLRAAIGPGIRSCCYQVGPELRNSFEAQFAYASQLFRETKERNEIHERYPLLFLTARAPGHSDLPRQIFLDLAQANRRQLLDAGLLARNISDLGSCTSCNPELFFSHRAQKGKTGRMMAVAGVRE
ncbi:MAG TPA: peptidoglycan editing factor PgeF [Terriglobales bacterium]|nr:peptidoglycan editing factor PgeF [Terriglobales bacterium]